MKNLLNKKTKNYSEHKISYLIQQFLRPALQCSKERVENRHGLEAKVGNVRRREIFEDTEMNERNGVCNFVNCSLQLSF